MPTPSVTSFAGVSKITSGCENKQAFQSLCTRCIKTAQNGGAHADEAGHGYEVNAMPCILLSALYSVRAANSLPWDGELIINAHKVSKGTLIGRLSIRVFC